MKGLKKILIIAIGIVLAGLYSYRTWPVSIYDTSIDSTKYENVDELLTGDKVEQTFVCTQDGLKAIEITTSNLGFENDVEYHWNLYENTTHTIIGEGSLRGEEIDNSLKSVFEFPKCEESKDKEYTFTIETADCNSEHGITVMKTKRDKEQKEGLRLNGKQEDNVLVLTQKINYFNVETGIVFLGLYLYLVVFLAFLTRLFR